MAGFFKGGWPLAVLLLLYGLASAAPASAWEIKVCADPDNAPYSARGGEGFDNAIAALLADELGATLDIVYMPNDKPRTFLTHLGMGDCDLVMGVVDNQKGYLTSQAYYRTGFVFVAPKAGKAPVASLNDPALATLSIGLQGDIRRPTVPEISLARRGLLANLKHFDPEGAAANVGMEAAQALSAGAIDVAILWGPITAALSRKDSDLMMTPVTPQFDVPYLPMVASMSVGMRPRDDALKVEVDRALDVRWDEIRAILEKASVPLLDQPRPMIRAEVRQ